VPVAGSRRHTVVSKVVQLRQITSRSVGVTRVWQACAWIPQLIEEGVYHGINSGKTLGRRVLEQFGDQIDRVGISLSEHLMNVSGCTQRLAINCSTYLTERMRLNLRELVLHVVGVHGADLVSGRRSQDLDDLYELVNTRLAREQWLSKHQLCHDATCGPHICRRLACGYFQLQHNQRTDLGGVVCGSKNQLRRAVVPGADVGHVRLVLDQDLGTSEIAELEDSG
jgi:hypothetical protein